MKYQITSDNIDLSNSMKVLATEKFEKIEHRLTAKEKETALARIVLNKSGAEGEFEVKGELSYNGKTYFATETNLHLETALIGVVNELERMRRKDDISYYDDWNEQREKKRELGEALMEDDLADSDLVE